MTEEKSPQPATPPALLTVDEVALLLRVAPKTVYRYLSQGQLPSVRFGGAVRVSRDDLLSFFASKGAQGGISAPERAGVAAAPLAKAACASCRRLLPQELLSATCLSPGCGGLLCNDCQAQWPSLLCPKHRPSLEQRLELARGQGRKVVLAGDAALWEQDFLNRFVTGVEALTQFPHPLGGASSARNAARRSEEPLGAQELPLAPEGPFPRGLATVYTFPAGRDGRPRWSLAAGVMVRMDRLTREGFDPDPIDRTMWQDWLAGFTRQAAADQRLWIVGIGSPTGWAADVGDVVAGSPDKRPFYDRWLALALITASGNDLRVSASPADGRLKPYLHLFLGRLPQEQEDTVRGFVQGKWREGATGVAASEVAQACQMDAGAVQGLFHQLERDGQGTTQWIEGFGLVLFRS